MALLKFLKGNYANLSNATITEGQILVCGDTGELFVDVAADKRVKIGDFITVANLTALETLDATKVPTSRLYYVEDGNILARSNGTTWVQVNKQKTAAEMKEFLGLGSMAYKSEVAEGDLNADLKAKVNAAAEGNHSHDNKALLDTYTQTEADLADAVAKKHAHANADELAKIADGDKAKWDAVAADHLTAADKTTLENAIKDAKKAGTDANTALETYKVSNDARVKAVEDDVAEITDGTNGILAQAKAYADGKDGAIAAAKKAGDDAQDAIDAYIESNNAALAGVKATAEAAATKEYTDAELAKKVDKVEGKSLIADSEIARLANVTNYDDTQVKADIAKKADTATMTTELGKKVDKVEGYSLVSDTEIARLADVDNYDDAEVRGLIGDNADAIDALAGKVGTVPEGQTVMGIIANIQENAYDDTELRGLIGDNANAIDAIEADYLKAADKTELSEAIAAEKTRAEGIEAGLRTDVDAIKGDYLKAADKEALQTQINTIMNNPDAEGAINSINEFTQYVEDHGTIADGFRTDIDKNKEDIAANAKAIEDEAGRADAAEKALAGRLDTLEAIDHEAYKGYADGLNTAMDTRVKTLEAIDYDAYVAADTALKTELQAEIDADVKALADGQVKTNTDAIATKANAADVYAKTETYTKAEVEALMTWGEF